MEIIELKNTSAKTEDSLVNLNSGLETESVNLMTPYRNYLSEQQREDRLEVKAQTQESIEQ